MNDAEDEFMRMAERIRALPEPVRRHLYLTEKARKTPHKFQRIRLEQLLKDNWLLSEVQTKDRFGTMLVLNKIADGRILVRGIYPNGLICLPKKGKTHLTFDWNDVRKYAEATIPTPGLLLDKEDRQDDPE